jgi:hypothetical protein
MNLLMKIILITYDNNNKYNQNKILFDLINKEYLSNIIMYKTWDNEYARKICIKIMEKVLLEKIYFFSLKNLKENFFMLKDYCLHGCIHLDLHFLINEIFLKSKKMNQ